MGKSQRPDVIVSFTGRVPPPRLPDKEAASPRLCRAYTSKWSFESLSLLISDLRIGPQLINFSGSNKGALRKAVEGDPQGRCEEGGPPSPGAGPEVGRACVPPFGNWNWISPSGRRGKRPESKVNLKTQLQKKHKIKPREGRMQRHMISLFAERCSHWVGALCLLCVFHESFWLIVTYPRDVISL